MASGEGGDPVDVVRRPGSRRCAPRACPASTSRSRKAIAPGAVGLGACQAPHRLAARRGPTTTSTGTCRAGSARFLNRQGYYSAVLGHGQGQHVGRTSGASGMEGKPAQKDIMSRQGKVDGEGRHGCAERRLVLRP